MYFSRSSVRADMQPLYLKKIVNAYIQASTFLDSQSQPSFTTVPMAPKMQSWWVGGTVEVTQDVLYFSANFANRLAHDHLNEVHIPTADMTSVEYEFGWFTGIVVVRHVNGEFRFRCYGAKGVVARLNEAFIEPRTATRSLAQPVKSRNSRWSSKTPPGRLREK